MDTECNCVIESLLLKPFQSLSFDKKKCIIETGRPMPNLSTLVTKSKNYVRSFKYEYYNSIKWLSGCKKTNKLYCWPCVIFSREENVWTKHGFSDLNNFHNIKGRHEANSNHIQCSIDLTKFGKTGIETRFGGNFSKNIEKHNMTVKINRYILSSMIDAICYLAQQELAFRGHGGPESSVDGGNYVELVYLMAQRDELLKTYLSISTIFNDFSEDIQNDLIRSTSNVLLKKIETEIRDTSFVAIIMDETTDVVSKSRLFAVLRYLNDNVVLERFLGFTDVDENLSAKALSEHLFHFISKFGCEGKLMAQTYDGVNIISGEHCGLQTLVRSKYENAIYVHCYAHKLDIVLKQSVEYIKECKIFFSSLDGLSAFFSKSTERVQAIENAVNKRLPFISGSIAHTKWKYNNGRLIELMHEHGEDVLIFMVSIMENAENWDSETLFSSRGYVEIIQDFDFVFFLKIFSTILPQATVFSEHLEKNIFDTAYCTKKIDELITSLKYTRKQFNNIWSQLENVNYGSQPKSYPSKLSEDKKPHYRTLFLEIFDVLINKIKQHYSNIDQLNFFALFDFNKFNSYTKEFPLNSFDTLKQLYGKYFDLPKLRSELSIIYATEEFQKTRIHDLLLYLKATNLYEHFSQTMKLISLILTIPATSASSDERSFSALKRVNTFAKNSSGQNRSSSLSMLSIEKKLLAELKQKPTFHDEVISNFLTKNKTIDLVYK